MPKSDHSANGHKIAQQLLDDLWKRGGVASAPERQASKVLREKRELQCKYKKARMLKWLEETDEQRQRCRQERTTTKRVKEVKEQQKDKNIAPGEEEADFVHHVGRDRRATAGEEQQIWEEFRGSPH